MNNTYTKPTKVACWTLACAALLVIGLHGKNYYLRFKAERMVRAVMALEPGKTSLQDAVMVADRYGLTKSYPDDGQPCNSHSLCVWNGVVGNRLPLDFPVLKRLGLRPWNVSTSFAVENAVFQGSSANISAQSPGPEGDLLAQITIEADPTRRRTFLPLARVTYRPTPGLNLCWQFHVNVSPTASIGEKQRALDIHFNCLVSPRACKSMSEFLPSAWADYERIEKKEVDWKKMEQEVKSDIRCHAEK